MNLGFIIWQFQRFGKQKRLGLNLVTFALCLETMTNIIIFLTSTDSHMRFFYPWTTAEMLVSNYIPFLTISTCMILLYWQELLNITEISLSSFITKLRIPFVVVAAILFILEISSSIFRAFGYGSLASTSVEILSFAFETLIFAFLGFFQLATVVQVGLFFAKKQKNADKELKIKMRNTLGRLITSVICYFGLCIFEGINFAADFGLALSAFSEVFTYRGIFFWIYSMALLISTMQITTFNIKTSTGTTKTTIASSRV